MCIKLVCAEGTGRMQLPPRPRAASQHGNQQCAKPRNEFKLTCIHTASFQGGNIPLGMMQGLVPTRGAAWMQGILSIKNIITYVKGANSLLFQSPLLSLTALPCRRHTCFRMWCHPCRSEGWTPLCNTRFYLQTLYKSAKGITKHPFRTRIVFLSFSKLDKGH